MDLKKLLETTPESLAQEQYDALRQAVVQRLGVLAGHVQRGEFDTARLLLFNSLAGDGNGDDNCCISFTDLMATGAAGLYETDIGDVIDRLDALKKMIKGRSK